MTEADIRKALSRRFIRYTAFDTMSDPGRCGIERPTTKGQIDMLEDLRSELEKLGLETYFGPEFVVQGKLKGNVDAPAIGFMAHVDTADDVPGNNVKARYVESYDGGDIVLSNGISILAKDNPGLAACIGRAIITSDGTTLLGADDKAGCAIMMEAINYLVAHPEIEHGDIEVYFTPDEETGSGMDMFPYDRLSSNVVYTLDGGAEGEIETECFNAASVALTFHGNSIHLGSARGILVNAVKMASETVCALPHAESPEATDGRYGYYCPLELKGTATEATLAIFIRDFDLENFEARIRNVKNIASAIADIHHGTVDIDVKVSYHNMAEVNKGNPKATDAIYSVSKELGIPVREELIRGGTDGARLAERAGVPSPNIFTGGNNYHSLREWISEDGMYSAYRLMLGLVEYWSRLR